MPRLDDSATTEEGFKRADDGGSGAPCLIGMAVTGMSHHPT